MAQKTVVVCDDNATLLMLMKQLLTKQGFNVLTAGDGVEGLDLVRSLQPDLLLLDLHMPEKDGFAVLEEMKSLTGKRPYTLVVSALEGKEKRAQAAALGAHEVWSKPFNAAELMSRVEALVAEGLI